MNLRIVKIGTSLLRGNSDSDTYQVIENYCKYISLAMDRGDQIILVSSGAVGLGSSLLKLKERPKEISSLQAIAAIGQGHLMSLYKKYMGRYNYNVAQILLTRSDLATKDSYRNASKILRKLLEWKTLPVVNENDSISNEELKYGDNDTLSALVATAVSADQLILLTDIDHLYSQDPKNNSSAKPIREVLHPKELKPIEESARKEVKEKFVNSWGTGGITTKLQAARIATENGITVHLADGRNPKNLDNLLNGNQNGTTFYAHPKPIPNRKSWLAHALKPTGKIIIDEGASDAIQNRGASLLLVGIKEVEGNFGENQPVVIFNKDNTQLGKGICSISSEIIRNSIENQLLSNKSPIVIHRDVLVLTSDLVD